MAVNRDAFARAVLRLYPRSWRGRYGDELLALLEERELTITALADLALGAIRERLHQVVGWRPSEMGRLQFAAIAESSGVVLVGSLLSVGGSGVGRLLALHGYALPMNPWPVASLQFAIYLRAGLGSLFIKDPGTPTWAAVRLPEVAFWLGLIFVGSLVTSMPYGTNAHAMTAHTMDYGWPWWAVAARGSSVGILAGIMPRQRARMAEMARLRRVARKAFRDVYPSAILGIDCDQDQR